MEANGLGAIMKGDLGATVAVCRDVYTEASRDQRGGEVSFVLRFGRSKPSLMRRLSIHSIRHH
eukprot:scaffold1189_cov182-Alexandrium_tamarense.AAC.2